MDAKNNPVVTTGMLIRRPANEVFGAFINPDITTNFWFTKSSGKLEEGKDIEWTWEMYNHTVPVFVKSVIPDEKIVIVWGNDDEKTTVEWTFKALDQSKTFVNIVNSGFNGAADELFEKINDSAGGFTWVLAGLKAYLEHDIRINLIADRFPKELGDKA